MINVGDRVVTIDSKNSAKPITGIVRESYVFNGDSICLIETDDGLLKVPGYRLELVPLEETPGIITISKEDFDKAVIKATNADRYKNMFSSYDLSLIVNLCGVAVCNALKRELFGETADND